MEDKVELKAYMDEYGYARCPNCKAVMKQCVFGKIKVCEECKAEVHIYYGGY